MDIWLASKFSDIIKPQDRRTTLFMSPAHV